MLKYLLIISFNLFNIQNSEWKLKKEENKIKVYLRENNDKIVEYLAETYIDSDINSIFNFISDFDSSYHWMYNLEQSKILNNDSISHVYFVMEMGWPLKKRDLVSDVIYNFKSDTIIVSLNSKPNYVEQVNNIIRIKDSKSTWTLIKVDENKTKVSLQSYALIDGVPQFITEIFIVDGPIYSLTNLKNNF